MRLIIRTGLFLLLLAGRVYAQPGVSDQVSQQIENAISSNFGSLYELDAIISVDSQQVDIEIPGVQITKSDQSLKGAYIFTVVGRKINPFTAHKGFIGLFKNGQILWHSDMVINDVRARSTAIEGIMDLNNDGTLEIITRWSEGTENGGPDYLWIFSWNGVTGTLLNDVDKKGQSVLVSVSEYFAITDLNGDGILEITGSWSEDTSIQPTENPVVYSWNGQKYGKWKDQQSSKKKDQR